MKYLSLIIALLCFVPSIFASIPAQGTIESMEIQLDSVLTALRESKQDEDFNQYNGRFNSLLEKALSHPEAFNYAFDSLKSMSKITSPDGAFRLFNWNVESEGGVHSFYCFILKKDGTIIELKDRYRFIDRAEQKNLNERNWYGAVYYEIIVTKRGKYTLLGWNGKDGITTQKVIETMSLSRKGAKFGFDFFEYPNDNKKNKRIILEYSDAAYVSLRYFATKKQEEIVFSHLSPSTPQMEGFFQYYYPDMSYDKFVLKNGKWYFESDSEVKNKKSERDDLYNEPE